MGCTFSLWPRSTKIDTDVELGTGYGHLSTEFLSKNVIITPDDKASGEGVILADTLLTQTKCYWEITIETTGTLTLFATFTRIFECETSVFFHSSELRLVSLM